MSNYTKSTNFATKDNLTPGDPLKIVRGTEIDTEFNNIATAIATKTDNASAAITGGSITGITDLAIADGGTGASTANAALNNLLPSQASASGKYLKSNGTDSSWDALDISTADITGTLPVANGGTGVTSSTGTGSVVLSNSPTLVTPALGTPASGVATNLTGLPLSTGVTGTLPIANGGTGQTTANDAFNALAPSQATASGKYLKSDGTNTSWDALDISTADITGTLPVANGGTGVTTSTGTGSVVLSNSPTLVTPALGTPSSGTVTNLTGTASININGTVGATTPTTGAFTTLSASSSVTLSGGTANGVTYLNGSKVLTSGSALTFDGTNFATTGAITSTLATTGAITATGSNNDAISAYIENSNQTGAGAADRRLTLLAAGNTSYFGVSIWQNRAVVEGNSPSGMAIGANATSAPLVFYAGSRTEGMRLTSTGLGIGTSSPTVPLTVGDSTAPTGLTPISVMISTNTSTGQVLNVRKSCDTALGPSISLMKSRGTAASPVVANVGDTAGGVIYSAFAGTNYRQLASINGAVEAYVSDTNISGYLVFNTNAASTGTTERMRLDSAGNLGLGVTPTSGWASNFKAFQVGTGGTFYGDYNNTTSYFGNNAYFNGTNWKYVSSSYALYAYQDRSAGKHIWAVAASGTAGNNITWTEAMTLDASGNLLVGTTSASAGNTFGTGVLARSTSKPLASVCDASSGSASVGIGRTNSTGNYVEFYYGTALTTSTGTISTNGTTTAYNTTSDQRLKENIADADSASSLIDSLQVRKFDWKADGSHQRYGFVAQELVAVAPEAVHQPEDTEEMMAVDYSKLVPMLVKEIQSLRQRLAAANL